MTTATIDRMLSIDEAASIYHVSITLLHHLIDIGKIKAAMLNDTLIIREVDVVADLPKEQRPEYVKFAYLKGCGIGMRAAGRKYGVGVVTIYGWVQQGWISVIGHEGKQKVLLDEADMAYCAEVYKNNPGQGKRIFNPDGTPWRKPNC